jgi:Transcriptional regulators
VWAARGRPPAKLLRVVGVLSNVEAALTRSAAAYRSLTPLLLDVVCAIWSDRWGGRNISRVCRRLRLPSSTVTRAIRRLERIAQPLTVAIPATMSLGLARLAVDIEPQPGRTRECFELMVGRPFWQSMAVCADWHISCFFAVPEKEPKWLTSVLEDAASRGVLKSYRVIPVCDPIYPPPRTRFKPGSSERLNTAPLKPTPPHPTNIESKGDLSRGFDDVDLRLIEQLELDGRMSGARIAKTLGLSRAAVSTRIRKIIKMRMIGFRLRLLPFPPSESNFFHTVFEAPTWDALGELAALISSLSFTLSYSLGRMLPLLVVRSQVPASHTSFYHDTLTSAVERGLVRNMLENRLLVPSTIRNQSVCPEYFVGGLWKTPPLPTN